MDEDIQAQQGAGSSLSPQTGASISGMVLQKIASAFPFSFFPDTLTIEQEKLNVVCRQPGAGWTHSVLIDNVTNVTIETALFFATLEITDSTNPRNVIQIKIRHIKPKDAFFAKALIEGLIKAKREHLDVSQIPQRDRKQRIIELGQLSADAPPYPVIYSEEAKVPHYYGDIVRVLFFLASVIMLVTLPFFQSVIPIPIFAAIIVILALGFIAGVTNPIQMWPLFINVGISFLGFLFFEYHAVNDFTLRGVFFFFVNQTLSVIFFFALYYSTKTVRGFMVHEKRPVRE